MGIPALHRVLRSQLRLQADKLSIDLYQSGYLTIKDYDAQAGEYVLGFPNVEVASAFSQTLLEQYYSVPFDGVDDFAKKLRTAFISGDMEAAMDEIRAFLASIDYEVAKPTECYFQTVIFVLFKVLGLECKVEMHTATGRVDLVLETQDFLYCFEFKLDKSAERALAQIDSNEYTLQWTGGNKVVYKVGVGFDSERRNIGEWKHVVESQGLGPNPAPVFSNKSQKPLGRP